MIEKTGIINNPYGIHIRPACTILKAFQGYKGSLEIENSKGIKAKPSSALSLLTLGLIYGESFTIRTTDDDAESADKMMELLGKIYEFKR